MPDQQGERSSAVMKGRGKREIAEKIRRPAASSVTIPTCENSGVTRLGIEPGSPWWEAISQWRGERRDAPKIQQWMTQRAAERRKGWRRPGGIVQCTIEPYFYEFQVLVP
ncbi:hypothetical protein PR048_004779 [Dryococelus australis]|uniref:Uncharacterized protein n=1 Tax=Dryococelus australis TaxID=614101 RepID=A0ABQ9I6E3_9NEOP|nr:hypothetical protein PR048_004779 [Dryococelus australis]